MGLEKKENDNSLLERQLKDAKNTIKIIKYETVNNTEFKIKEIITPADENTNAQIKILQNELYHNRELIATINSEKVEVEKLLEESIQYFKPLLNLIVQPSDNEYDNKVYQSLIRAATMERTVKGFLGM